MTKEKPNVKRGANNPAALREKAQRLIEEAERMEKEALVKIGRLTLKYYDADFNDMAKFKRELEALRG